MLTRTRNRENTPLHTYIYTLYFPLQAKCSSWTDSLMVPSLPLVLRWNTEILFCTLYSLKVKRTEIEIQSFNYWIAAGNRLCWERPGGPAGPDDLHLPKDDQVHLPQVRQQRRGQQHEDHDDHDEVPYQRKSKWCLPKVVCILTGRPMPIANKLHDNRTRM